MEENQICFEVETTYKSGYTRSEVIAAKDEENLWKYYDKHHNAKMVENSVIIDAWPA